LLKITDVVVGLRVSTEEVREERDIVLHEEQVFRSSAVWFGISVPGEKP
jgi:hypothetical protein